MRPYVLFCVLNVHWKEEVYINTTNNMLYLLRYLHVRFYEHSCNVHNPNNISIISGANEG